MGPKKTQKDTSMDESADISHSSDQDTLTELLKTLVTTMSKGQEDMANLMKITLNKESKTQEEYRVERERLEKQKRRERILTKIADIKDGDDPEVYSESLKNKLIQDNFPQDEWKLLLISHLTGRYLVMIQDIKADPGYGFEEVQSRILDCCGLTSTMAGQQFHKFRAVDAKDMGTAQLIQTLKRLITRVLKGSQTIDEDIELLFISKVRYLMSSRGEQFLDGRTPMTESDLREALQCWESTERSICEECPVWSVLCGTDPSCRQVHHPINALTVVRQATWPGSVQVLWIAASRLSLLLGRKTLFVMLAARLDTKFFLSKSISFKERT